METDLIVRDEIMEEVKRVREEIARRYDFDVDRIFEAVKERNAGPRETKLRRQLPKKVAQDSE